MFTKGTSYVRREIHEMYGGQRYGGISTPADYPIILLFTGEQGEQYGYHDGWNDEGVFLYTGEGREGDMDFIRGNKAIRDHNEDGKSLHLFKYVDRGIVQYVGEMFYIGFFRQTTQDMQGNPRNAIVFELLPIETFDPREQAEYEMDNDLEGADLEELRQRAINDSMEERPPRESKHNAHYRSSAVRAYVLRRAGGSCEACGEDAPFVTVAGRPYLEPHHIRRVADGGPDHPEWVIGVCPNCHRRAHYAEDKVEFNETLRQIVLEREQNFDNIN